MKNRSENNICSMKFTPIYLWICALCIKFSDAKFRNGCCHAPGHCLGALCSRNFNFPQWGVLTVRKNCERPTTTKYAWWKRPQNVCSLVGHTTGISTWNIHPDMVLLGYVVFHPYKRGQKVFQIMPVISFFLGVFDCSEYILLCAGVVSRSFCPPEILSLPWAYNGELYTNFSDSALFLNHPPPA